jgi:hypothetical protein
MENLSNALGGLVIISGLVLTVFIMAKYNYLIKKAMIEKGLTTEPSNVKLKFIDIGCIVISLGIGFIVSSIYTTWSLTEDTTDLLVWGTISIFGGIGLIAAQIMRRKLEK